MNAVTSVQFGEFFESLYGYGPFPWQDELARRVAEAQPGDACWPKALALPTAAGKTACIDMAIFALACQSDRSAGKRTAPRRIFFVVDRRVIVDETFERARRLAQKLRDARKSADGILKDMADSLCSLAQGDDEDEPLAVFQLRGGMYRDDAWARSPLQPTIVVTTVDQYASRLLFRGYGSSAGMRPVHAGLAANDCLVLLDEAHCANPFRQTVTSVQRYRDWAMQSAGIDATPFHLTLISATPPPDIVEADLLTAGDKDRKHYVLGRRIGSAKPARLVIARKASGDDALEHLAKQVADESVKLVGDERKAIGVMVNRVDAARLVYQHLYKDGRDVTLLTGRMRAIDRDDVVRDLDSLKTGSPREDRERFIIATQTLEVGADLDFDGLVTECASIDALRQRFGRLDRDGRAIEARATIVIRADQSRPNRGAGNDPVYGTALTETWQWLNEKAGKDGIDFGYEAMNGVLPDDREELGKLQQQAADAPVLLPAHLDAWVQTWPVPTPDPDVSLFLHGPDRGAPEVQVCWRADLKPDMQEERQVEIVSLCPPASSECISVPIHFLRRWIEGTGSGAYADDNDLEGSLSRAEALPSGRSGVRRSILCWRGPDDSRLITGQAEMSNLHSGDTVVIPAKTGGWEVFGHIPPDNSEDLGDRAYLQSRAKPLLRIHPEVVKNWPETPARAFFMDLAGKSESSEEWDELEAEIPESLEKLAAEIAEIEETPRWQWLKDAARALAGECKGGRSLKIVPYPGNAEEDSNSNNLGFVLQGSRRVGKYMASASTLTSEDDSYSAMSRASARVSLDDHLRGVEGWAKRFGQGAGLPDSLVEDLALAARLHDVGKADPRFQAMLHGGHPWAALVGGTLLAKSGSLPTSKAEDRRARRESRYPKGARHELLSVRLIESVPNLLEPAHDRDLVLHLVASHHGRCRPFAPVVSDSEPINVEDTILGYQMSASSDTGLERLDSGVPERFWRLVRRYGWWGLAWLEALMRLADHRCSEAEQKNHEDPDDGSKEASE